MAIKRIFIDGKSEQEIVQLQREVDLLKSLSHPSVVKYEGLVRTEHFVNIVLEYVENGSLQHTLASFAPLPEPLVQSYMVKILEGLVYLHSMHVIHRDLKCANILTTKKGNIKVRASLLCRIPLSSICSFLTLACHSNSMLYTTQSRTQMLQARPIGVRSTSPQ